MEKSSEFYEETKSIFSDVSFSEHCLQRLSLRKINKRVVNYCLNYGKVFYKTGIRFYVLLKKQIEEYNLDSKLEGICVLISNDGTIISAYKNKVVTKRIKTLSKRKNRKQRSYAFH